MAKENATYISELVATNPTATDSVSVGDDHLRMLKTVLRTQFSGLSGTTAITSSEAEMNLLDGKTSVGDASGPGSSVDNAIARFDGTGGKTLQNSTVTISDDPPVITVGDGTAEDIAIKFDGNTKDFHIALDDTADKLVIGEGSTVGTNEIISITDDTVTIGDGATVDTYLNFDGNAADFRIGIDDGTDKLEIGGGVAHGSATGIAMDVNGDMTLGGGIVCSDEVISRPRFTDYAETVNAIGSISAGTNADLEDGNVQSVTFTANTFNFGITNALASHSNSLTLIITNGGLATATWLSGAHGGGGNAIQWAGGTAPTLTNSGTDILVFTTMNGGTNWYGFAAAIALAAP